MSLGTWVSDQLIEILDFSDHYTSKYQEIQKYQKCK
jgi:hypothetical protein